MALIRLDEQGFPSTPSAGQIVAYPDSSNSQWIQRNDNGIYLGDQSSARTTQISAHSADTYYIGMQLPSHSMQPGTVFEWYFPVTKGAAGVATPVYTIRIGANQTTADTSRLALTGPAQTAAADAGFVRVMVTCRTVGAAAFLQGMVWLQHNLAATGFANTPAGFSMVEATSAAFDNTNLGGQYIGLSVNPGASGGWVVNQVLARCWY
jgi:hypothetical protein